MSLSLDIELDDLWPIGFTGGTDPALVSLNSELLFELKISFMAPLWLSSDAKWSLRSCLFFLSTKRLAAGCVTKSRLDSTQLLRLRSVCRSAVSMAH